jgi:acetylornithine deacetylase/succinyl-diaminopimelate desuccinylase-like protein
LDCLATANHPPFAPPQRLEFPAMKAIDQFIESHRQAFVDDLSDLLRIPSVSADSRHAGDVRQAAEWMQKFFTDLGLKTELINTAGHPLVVAESPPVPGKPVALVYGHYDVQPPDPLSEWITPAFEPSIRNGNIVARGATDDKGQMLTHVMSVAAWLKSGEKLPLQVKFLIEGEEEVGSANLEPFVAEHRERLACDCVVISDCGQFAPGVPAITYGLRGIAYYELKLTGPRQDLHSGTFGGGVTNPAGALVTMLAALKDADGRIQVPGFYDDVLPLTDVERQQFLDLPFCEDDFHRNLAVETSWGEAGFTNIERRWARPTCDINGLTSGYQGEGAKTVLPARANAKFSFRLVPNQDPAKISIALKQFLVERVPPGIRMELIDFHGAPGVVVPLESPYIRAAADAIEAGFGTAPVYIREGGSIPIVNTFARELDADVLLLGWGQNDDNTHSPNEKFSLDDYQRGIKASAHLWNELAKVAC